MCQWNFTQWMYVRIENDLATLSKYFLYFIKGIWCFKFNTKFNTKIMLDLITENAILSQGNIKFDYSIVKSFY